MDKPKLTAQGPFHNANLPARFGAANLAVVAQQSLTMVAPFNGQAGTVAKAMGVDLPKAGKGSPDLFWFAQNQWMTSQSVDIPDGVASLTDQSDMWAALDLTGEDAGAVMARLTSLDLAEFGQGDIARAEFAHISAVLLPVENGYRILVMRSFAGSAAQHIIAAMKSVAAQALLA